MLPQPVGDRAVERHGPPIGTADDQRTSERVQRERPIRGHERRREVVLRETDLGPEVVQPELVGSQTEGAVELSSDFSTSGANAEPNHVIISRLQNERDCYRRSERTVRLHLERLQNALLESNAIEAGYLSKVKVNRILLTAFGALWGYLYGLITNIWFWTTFIYPLP